MDIDQASIFLSGSILIMLGFIVITIGIVAINNIVAKYWKPVKWLRFEYQTVYFDAKDGSVLVPTPQKEPK
jgi:hypothetical protein